MREVDLYAPIRDWLVANGYEVRGEVSHCDIAARKDDELIVIELKCRFGIELLVQAVDRQRLADSVYIAVPGPPCGGRSKKWRGFQRLARRLEIGLLFCKTRGRKTEVVIVFHPLPSTRRKQKRQRTAVLQEIAARSGDHNVGGSTRTKLMTSYRENAIRIAALLDRHGPLTPRKLREYGTGTKTLGILRNNVYGWFERVDRGVYRVSSNWKTHAPVYEAFLQSIEEEVTVPTT
ncbi:MAG: DUF2161 family putative PD-(D/E)XK-type phosphodiesterase [Candidatus Sumerlaeaceae bacterium]